MEALGVAQAPVHQTRASDGSMVCPRGNATQGTVQEEGLVLAKSAEGHHPSQQGLIEQIDTARWERMQTSPPTAESEEVWE